MPELRPPTVLVVDDSDTVRRFAALALRARGLRVLTARDGLDALERLTAEPADLVLTDLSMPGLDGYALIRALREDAETAGLPILILSSLPADADRCGGANAYLPKPLDAKRLQYEVAKYLG